MFCFVCGARDWYSSGTQVVFKAYSSILKNHYWLAWDLKGFWGSNQVGLLQTRPFLLHHGSYTQIFGLYTGYPRELDLVFVFYPGNPRDLDLDFCSSNLTPRSALRGLLLKLCLSDVSTQMIRWWREGVSLVFLFC